MFQGHPPTTSPPLGTELERARLARHLTQRGLSAQAGVGRVTLANLERGHGSVAALVTVLAVLEHRFTDQPSSVELGPWLAQRRKQAGLSQDRLCAVARVSKPALVKVEHGRGHVSTLVAVMNALGLPLTLQPVDVIGTPRPCPAPTARLLVGDCRDHMRDLADEGALVDAIVCDPPYHLSGISKRDGRRGAAPLTGGERGSASPYRSMATGFMNQTWDGGGIAFEVETWRAAFAVLKPGGYLVAFGSARTFFRLGVAIEDAGFDVRDTIMWVYGSGFPKSYNLKGEHVGRGTALKPAYEPILIARKPITERNVAANVLRYGTGGLNIDACRVRNPSALGQSSPSIDRRASARQSGKAPGRPGEQGSTITNRISPERYTAERLGEALGRWPANLIHDGSPAVLAGFPSTGKSRGGGGLKVSGKSVYGTYKGAHYEGEVGYGDEGSAARFFYAAKASKADRGTGNKHPTVKPNDLMRYLVRLVTPPGGTIYDPFTGSGSTGVAALQEDFSFLGSEMMAEYVEIARLRIGAVGQVVPVEPKPDRPPEVA